MITNWTGKFSEIFLITWEYNPSMLDKHHGVKMAFLSGGTNGPPNSEDS